MPRAATSSDVFNAVAEPQRRAILEFIAGDERSVSEIVDALELAQPSVSKHLRVLRDVGLVTARRSGKQILYRTNATELRPLHEWAGMFERLWRNQLQRIKERAEREEDLAQPLPWHGRAMRRRERRERTLAGAGVGPQRKVIKEAFYGGSR